MLVTAKGRYALRMMLDIAALPEGVCVSLRDVSARQEISVKYLEQVAAQLVKAGLLKSVRGAQGGYLMAKPPRTCTAGDVLRAAGGGLAPAAEKEMPCQSGAACAAASFWEGFDRAVNGYMDGVSLKDLIDAQIERGYDYSI
ncbi:MAG TPA: Rrf2 family transcriptional regulator [Clostridia bacterium]|nr:Rrf2 family transcriptional regulator [Clostridia bacterium]